MVFDGDLAGEDLLHTILLLHLFIFHFFTVPILSFIYI